MSEDFGGLLPATRNFPLKPMLKFKLGALTVIAFKQSRRPVAENVLAREGPLLTIAKPWVGRR